MVKVPSKRSLRLGTYQHFRGNLYKVIGVALHSETLKEFVVYQPLYRNKLSALWVRPKEMFLGKVRTEGKQVARFKLCAKPSRVKK